MDEALKELRDYISDALAGKVEAIGVAYDELMVTLQPDALIAILNSLRDDQNCQFKQICDITAVDYPQRAERFEVVYNLMSHRYNQRIRLKVLCDEDEAVPSATGLFPGANWFEREVWDMYGIPFSDHPDLRRMLSDYGFEGHPLRKDFPLTGYVEVRYDEELKRVVYEPVKLVQDFRSFQFESPWEGMLQLPGDEKAESAEEAG